MENIDKNISPKDEPEDLSRAITKEYLNKLNLKKEENKVSTPSPIAKSNFQQLKQKILQENKTKIKKTTEQQQDTLPLTLTEEERAKLESFLSQIQPCMIEGEVSEEEINNCKITDPANVRAYCKVSGETTLISPFNENVEDDLINRAKIVLFFESEYLRGINQLPFGIFNKNRTGVGATSLELRSERNSIIVCPTRALAYNKYRKDPEVLMYVGGPIGSIKKSINKEQVKNYIEKMEGKNVFKKFLVVADSLPVVLSSLKDKGEKPDDYFLMVDEIDSLQSDSSFRPVAEDIIDYYLKHPEEKRCLLSATIKEFSHPELAKIPVIHAEFKTPKNREIKVIHSTYPDSTVVKHVLSIIKDNNQKVVIAYNSIASIKIIIKLLEKEKGEDISNKIAVLCGTYGKEEVNEYYATLQEDKLPNQINFITSAYFVGVDIKEDFHLVSVANVKRPQTLLSMEKLAQIAGRCRKTLLSDTIIYNIKGGKEKVTYQAYRQKLEEEAQMLLAVMENLEQIEKEKPRFKYLFEKVRDAIKNTEIEGVKGLVRKNIEQQYTISYLLIDSLCEKHELLGDLYCKYGRLENLIKTSQMGNIIDINWDNKASSRKEELKELQAEQRREQQYKTSLELAEARQQVMNMEEGNWDALDKMINESNHEVKKFLTRIKMLGAHTQWGLLAKHLLVTKGDTTRNQRKDEFEKFYLGVKYWALDADNKFKIMINSCFETGKSYTSEDIENNLQDIFNNWGIPVKLPKNQGIKLFRKLIHAERDESYKGKNKPYIIKGEYINHLFEGQKPKLSLHKDIDFTKFFQQDLP